MYNEKEQLWPSLPSSTPSHSPEASLSNFKSYFSRFINNMCLWLSFNLSTSDILCLILFLVEENLFVCSPASSLSSFQFGYSIAFDNTKCFIIIIILLLFTIEWTMILCLFLNNSFKKLIIVTFYLFSLHFWLNLLTSSNNSV